MKKQYSWIFKVFLMLPVIFSFFCGSENPPQKGTVIYEKDNVTYVENPASQTVDPPVYELSEVLSIGSGEDGKNDENYVFVRPRRLAVDGNGHIYVMDCRKLSVFAFDEKGVFLRKYGRRGEGPGEFVIMLDFAVDDRNRMLHILDLKHNKISRFLLDGTLHSEIKVDKFVERLFLADGNTYYIVGNVRDENDKELINIIKYSLDGKKLATSSTFPRSNYIIINKGDTVFTLQTPFDENFIIAHSPNGNIFWGMTDDYRFEVYNPVFRKVKIIKKDVSDRVKVTIEEKEQFLKERKEKLMRGGFDPSVIDSSIIDRLPDYYPIYYSFWFDGDGRLWVPLIRKDDQIQYIDIFDREGIFVETRAIKKPAGILTLADIFDKPAVKGEFIYATVRDIEGNWLVKGFKLVLLPEAARS